FITPGGIFGTNGNNFLRISLCSNMQQLQTCLERVQAWSNQ
ncbi:MAG: aminotransferase, partial [Bacteroidetes bacterium]